MLDTCIIPVLEITVGHWPFQHLANQNPIWSAKFTVHFNGMIINDLQNVLSSKNGQPISTSYATIAIHHNPLNYGFSGIETLTAHVVILRDVNFTAFEES